MILKRFPGFAPAARHFPNRELRGTMAGMIWRSRQAARRLVLSWSGRITLLLVATLVLTGCTSLPEDVQRPPSTTFSAPQATQLGQSLGTTAKRHPGETAFVVLDTGREAFKSRASLIDGAEHAIDAQYYIWSKDRSGQDLAARTLAAADRGVQVRVLLDDFGIGTKDESLSALDTHPHIEIRLYNPLPPSMRTGARRWLGLIADFERVAPRMHNKHMLVDGTVTIIGGRNIADEYFDLREDVNFRDRDLMFHGPLTARAAESFDVTWNSIGAYPIAAVSSVQLDTAAADAILDALRAYGRQTPSPIPVPDTAAAARKHIHTVFSDAIWAPAELIYNQPEADGERRSFDRPGDIAKRLYELSQDVDESLLIESGYLVTDDVVLERYRALKAQGVDVDILTNSLPTNDVLPLHGAYARSRRAIIDAGVALHELRPDAASCVVLVGDAARCALDGILSLHSKSIVFDDDIVYVGSFNMNPRSVFLNTENAVIVKSSELATRIANDIRENLDPANSWRVDVNSDNQLQWSAEVEGETVITTSEPSTGGLQRTRSLFYSLLPIGKYL